MKGRLMAEEFQEDTGVELQATSPKDMQPKWKNPPSRADLQHDYKSAEDGQEEFRAKLSTWADTMEGGKAPTVKKGKSTARPLLVREQAEWKYPSLTEPILGTRDLFKISPVGGEDSHSAKQNSLVLNNQWTHKINRTKLVDDIARNIVDEGTVIVKTGWEAEEGVKMVEAEEPVYASAEESLMIMQQQVQAGQMTPEKAQAMIEVGEPVIKGYKTVYVEQETLTKNQPTYEVCANANVTIDPTCEGVISDALFVIHEYDTSYADLKADEYVRDEESGEEWGFYHNIDMIELTGDEGEVYDEFKSSAANNFKFKDKARKQLRAYEYWGYWDVHGDGELVGIVATWVGSTLIRLEENPFPHGRLPFSVATYMPVKREVHGEPDAHLLKDQQDSVGKMTRAIHDITAEQAVGQEFIDERFFPSPSQKNAYEKGNTVYYRSGFNPKDSIYKNSVQQVGSTPFDVINWNERKAKEISGTKGLSAGAAPSGKLGGNSSQKDSLDPAAKRELSVLRRIAAMFVDMARMTIAMNQVFLSEEETVRITGDEFVTIARDDLEGSFDLNVEISTPEKDEDQANKIKMLMQTNAANMDPEIANMHYIQMAELWKLPVLADKVRDYKPKPDPLKQELMALQLEEQKLKNALAQKQLEDYDSKIFERLSRTDENAQSDAAVKQAKAEQALATAEKIRAETDILDQSFIMVQSGEQRKQDVEDQEYAANVGAAKEQQKSDAQAGLEHIKNSFNRTPGKVIAEI